MPTGAVQLKPMWDGSRLEEDEAFHDVYANRNKAKKTSSEIVKEYEKRQKNLTTEKFFRKKRSLWTRFRNWMKML